jgi:hypothetical protein
VVLIRRDGVSDDEFDGGGSGGLVKVVGGWVRDRGG